MFLQLIGQRVGLGSEASNDRYHELRRSSSLAFPTELVSLLCTTSHLSIFARDMITTRSLSSCKHLFTHIRAHVHRAAITTPHASPHIRTNRRSHNSNDKTLGLHMRLSAFLSGTAPTVAGSRLPFPCCPRIATSLDSRPRLSRLSNEGLFERGEGEAQEFGDSSPRSLVMCAIRWDCCSTPNTHH